MAELSGLGVRKREGKLEVLAVGDSKRKIASADLSRLPLSFVVHDSLESAEAESQWEAVAGDSTGRVFALEENPGVIYVLDPELRKEEARITLDVSGPAWDVDDGNSRGEGLVLMKNGHLLVLKEKAPSELVEFGPKGESATGYFPGAGVSMSDAFPVPEPDKRRYVVLKEWPIGDSSSKVAPDTSDLAVGPDGVLYVLSDQGRSVSSIEKSVGPDEKRFKLDTTWRLPSAITKPEGLAFLPDGRFLVASDEPGNGEKRLFLLSKLVR